MRISRWAFVGVVFGYVLIDGLGCGNSDSTDPAGGSAGAAGTATQPGLDDVIYEAGVTDETVASMLGVAAKTDDTRGALITTPADGAVLPADTPFQFIWSPAMLSLAPGPVLPAFSPASGPAEPRPSWPSWLAGERSAHAHGAPFTGIAYFVVFSTPSNPKLLRLATKNTAYTPDAAAWTTLIGAKETITVAITAARIEGNLLVDGGGPFVTSKGTSFTIQ